MWEDGRAICDAGERPRGDRRTGGDARIGHASRGAGRRQAARGIAAPQRGVPGWQLRLDGNEMKEVVLGHFGPEERELQRRMFAFMQDDLFKPRYGLDVWSYRELTLQRLQKVCAQGFIHAADVTAHPKRFMAGMQCLHFADYTLSIKAGVHFTLAGGTIAKLGTKYHHETFLPKIDSLELPSCYGMTELGHGSNVMAIETVATYDPSSQTFDLFTPNNLASKFWIGGSAQHGKLCAVFAQLRMGDQWQGPHVFLVRIRDDDGNLMPNVRIKDCGSKMGLQGVDNGQIWFDHVKVPRENMLNRLANVSPQGEYTSPLKSVAQRFGATVGGLTMGRFLIAAAAVDASKIGLIVAVRYSCMRTQFKDKKIMEYVTHQRRLVPALATTYGLEFAMQELSRMMRKSQTSKEVHFLSSGLKAYATWHRVKTLQDCREACGGMGFLSENQIGPIMTDMNVDVTFEGDNTVLMQQVVKGMLASTPEGAAGAGNVTGPTVQAIDQLEPSLLALLRWREAVLFKEFLALGGREAKAFDENLDLVLSIGRAHTERRIFEIFQVAAIDVANKPEIKDALLALCHLFGVWCVEQDLSTFVSRGGVSRQAALGVRDVVNAMCASVCAEDNHGLLALCTGFGIPEQFITAPIAHNWTKINAKM
ncbi:Acyl-coenzyme A oxidase 3, peroxisomal [Porphyridium purpureum]|uniref:Acyl-coenzyme A oxidase n=1 Tax=Porphyridium purpureum TaxID=35688 RepID=A0A5J4YS40_PORPP|nr:Acyl-coenzyme A oxidase 3, peroxisomal [Porphyridium purpureum]|eukprot:POR2845..scf236_6